VIKGRQIYIKPILQIKDKTIFKGKCQLLCKDLFPKGSLVSPILFVILATVVLRSLENINLMRYNPLVLYIDDISIPEIAIEPTKYQTKLKKSLTK
jgi:type IV secretory pathway TrbF-like protein